ncbi:MAG TPA: Clp protease N-terminal domain-containing protein, partial [Ktedonobacterales bacterium]
MSGLRRPRRRRRNPAWRRGSVRLYRALLWLYPPSLRRAYGDDMLQLFRDTLRDDIARSGPPGALRAWGVTLADLATSLPREWPRELRRGRFRPGRVVVTHNATTRLSGIIPAGRIEESRHRLMNDKFEQFTERARKVLSLSQEEAQRFNHNYIGTEHLLLGLVREGDGVAAKVLTNLGVELLKARSSVEFIIGRGDRIVVGEVGLTPRAKKVIELAVDEARRLNHHYIGTEHLLLGLVREGEGIAAGVLESLGVNLEKVRT